MIKKILCVCKDNTSLSPILEALLRLILGQMSVKKHLDGFSEVARTLSSIIVESAGTHNGDSANCLNNPANPHSITCMAHRGINISGHKSRPLSTININDFDLIVCMSDAEVEFISKLHPRGAILLANAANGGIANPYEKGPQAYQECAKTLEPIAAEIIQAFF